MERLASGNAVYETPDAKISEKRIKVELEPDMVTYGEIDIKGKNAMAIKGIVYSSDEHLTFAYNQFNGVNNKVQYAIDSKNLLPGQICDGTISVVTTAGDYAIPFTITVKEKTLEASNGEIKNLKDFVSLVKDSYDEALILFMSKEFQEYFLANNDYANSLYKQVMRNTNHSIAMEEFLVAMGLKEHVKISVKNKIKEYTDITENYGDVLSVARSTWGYVDIDVQVVGDFFYNCREKISGDEFNGKIAEYQYFINAAKLHGGSNCGQIIFTTANQTIVYDVVIVNEKNTIDEYIKMKSSDINLVKNYLSFRTGQIDSKKWIKETTNIAEQRLMVDKDDITGLLLKAQVNILNHNDEHANNYLSKVSSLVSVNTPDNVFYYCYYLYLKALYNKQADYTYSVKQEIEKYYENGYDKWQLLWILFNMDDRYDENPSLKYTLIKRKFSKGCKSPIMYFEAASVLNKQPELLRVINTFELQVLNFAGKYHIIESPLANQAADIISNEHEYNERHIKILKKLYQETESDNVLSCICQELISGNKKDNESFKWLKAGVKKELKITNLYEYYIYSIDTNSYEPLEKTAYKYFSYGTETLMFNKDYFYANLLENISEDDELYEKFKPGLEKYITEQVMQGNNNRHLCRIYSKMLTDSFLQGNLTMYMPEIMNTYRIIVKNKNINSVIVSHKEVETIQYVPLIDCEAYINLYTADPIIVFMDNNGRILADVKYSIEKMDVTAYIFNVGSNLMTHLNRLEDIMKTPADFQGEIIKLINLEKEDALTDEFRHRLREFIVEYYYKGFDHGDFDSYLTQLNMEQLEKESRNKVIEILIKKNLFDLVFPYIEKYGYTNIDTKLLEKVCIYFVKKDEYKDNELLTKMCAKIFQNGCREESVLVYLGKYYGCGTLELYQLFMAIQSKGIQDNTLAERLLVQYIFEGSTEEKIYDIFCEYLKGSTATVIRKAFYTYVTYNTFIKKVQCRDIVWDILEQEYDNKLATPIICKIAFIEEMSKRTQITEKQINICHTLIDGLVEDGIIFEFYKKFNKWFKIPFELVDKTIIDYRTNPKHRVNITYSIKKSDGQTKEYTEEMTSIYQGIFTKNIILFYGEEVNYNITEYSDEYPYGKKVENSSIKITEKNAYNDESRFGMINGMMICKDIGRDDAAREMMQSYQLCKTAGQNIFKLL